MLMLGQEVLEVGLAHHRLAVYMVEVVEALVLTIQPVLQVVLAQFVLFGEQAEHSLQHSLRICR
jgi:hypothetical protein